MQSNLPRKLVNLSAVSFNSSASLSSSFTNSSLQSSSSPPASSPSSRRSASTWWSHSLNRPLIALTICWLLLGSVSPSPISAAGNDKKSRLLDTNGHDISLSDEPPRPLGDTQETHWHKQPHERLHYLRAADGQFLAVANNTIYGTRIQNALTSIFQMLSEQSYLVIRHYHSYERFLCLNSNFTLYLSESVNSDCYLRESEAPNGRFQLYEFVMHKKYLGLDCDPFIGTAKDTTQKIFMFQYKNVDEAGAKAAKNKSNAVAVNVEHCVSKLKRKQQKMLEKMLTTRWCWNLNRMSKQRDIYLKNCNRKYCGREKADCVCNKLQNMLNNVKRWKRKCIARRVDTWLIKRNKTLQKYSPPVTELSKRLLPVYPNIAKRAQKIACRKKNSTLCKPIEKTARVRPLKLKPLLEKLENELVTTSNGNFSSKSSHIIEQFIQNSRNHTRKHKRRHHKQRRRDRKPKKHSRKKSSEPKKSDLLSSSLSGDLSNSKNIHAPTPAG